MEQRTVDSYEEAQQQDESDEGMQIALSASILEKVYQLGRNKFHLLSLCFAMRDQPKQAHSQILPANCSVIGNRVGHTRLPIPQPQPLPT